MKPKRSAHSVGILGTIGMAAFYYLLLFIITTDPLHPLFFFSEKWYFLAPLFLGFGFQMYLFQKLRIILHENSLKMAGASAGTNGVAMAACCAHHLAEIFPILGFAGAAAFMTDYQDWFLALGVVINLIGILYMWSKLKQHREMACCETEGEIQITDSPDEETVNVNVYEHDRPSLHSDNVMEADRAYSRKRSEFINI